MKSLFLGVGLLFSASAMAADTSSYRCGNYLAQLGDSLYEVQDKCGQPKGAYRWTEARAAGSYSQHGGEYSARSDDMERLTYGAYGKFDTYLIFRNGNLERIEQGSRR